jgi:hypothetical protein
MKLLNGNKGYKSDSCVPLETGSNKIFYKN